MSLKTILRFEVLRELGKGSLGTVYRALDPATQKTVAIREICEEGLSPRLIAQIREKAGAALTLDSPNIVRTLEVGSRAPFFYVVTEYVEGLTLRKLMSQTDGFSEWDVIDITRQACTAIDHAHSRGLTHANLHPGNIVQE